MRIPPSPPGLRPAAAPSLFRSRRSGGYSAGFLIIALLAIASSVLIFLRPPAKSARIELWSFASLHIESYEPLAERWNRENPDRTIGFRLFEGGVHERRILSSFRSDTDIGDLLEVHETIASSVFAGPLEDVGFVDLTDRIEAEGLREKMNAPSFSPWTSRGRTFGLPHDVHPVVLAYRSDLVEAAGIDMDKIETWDDFRRELAPLMAERDRAGRPARYLLSLWPTQTDSVYALLMQAGGGAFLPDGTPALDRDINAVTLSRIATWCAGPSRIATEVPEFTASGNRLRAEGIVVAGLLPDWLAGIWQRDIPELAGKLKVIPLPAWEPNGRRTSVMGGTMLGIARSSPNIEDAWDVAKYLYLNAELWDELHPTTLIIPPVKAMWDRPVYHQPSAYFSGQKIAQVYIRLAPDVPNRVNSAFLGMGTMAVQKTVIELARIADARGISDPRELEADARRLLAFHQEDITRRIARNVLVNR